MAYSKDEIIRLIQGFIEELRKDIPVERAYLFGSYATGRTSDHSDIDLALISPEINSESSFIFNKKIFHRAMLYNVELEPICFSPEEFEKEQLPIIRAIKQSGMEILTTKANSNS